MQFKKYAAKSSVLAFLVFAVCNEAGAQTNVQVGGLIDTYMGSIKRSGDAASTSVVNSGGMNTSWWGFKGTEDLGAGLQAQFALTGFFRSDVGASGRSSSDTMFSRDANVGLSGSFGRISLGRDLAPNFIPTITLNPFGGSFAFAPILMHTQTSSGRYPGQSWSPTVAGDTGWSNEIMYVTPKLAGFTTSLFLQLGEQAGNAGKRNYAANTMYAQGGLTLGAYFQSVQLNNPTDAVTSGSSRVLTFTPYNEQTGAAYTLASSKQNASFAGGSYDFKLVKLYATYNYSTSKLATVADNDRYKLKSSTVQLGSSVPAGTGAILFSWARTNVKADGDFTANVGGNGWKTSIVRNTASLGYDLILSRRTDIYNVVNYDKITDSSSGSSLAVGIRHRF